MNTWKLAGFSVGITFAVACTTLANAESEEMDSHIPLNERATAEAWAAIRAGEYGVASAKAQECIQRYQPAADKIQAILEQEKTVLPTGSLSEAEKQRVYRYQILHDVAACLLIRSWVAESAGRKDEALKARAEAEKYTYARIRGGKGEPFRAPAEVAAPAWSKSSR